jgi:hypothetical protein
MSIKTDIEAYTGDIDRPDYTTEALQFVNDGIRYIYSLVLTNPEMATRLASEETLNTSTASSKLLPELRNGVTLYAASNILLKKMNAIGKPTDTNLATMVAGDVDTAGDRIDITKWFDIVGDYIQDEDVELASAYLSKINSYLQNYQMELTGDQSQYQWYESQYVKVSQSLVAFLEPYVGA